MQFRSFSMITLLAVGALAAPAPVPAAAPVELSKRGWGYGDCENRQGELADLYNRCVGKYRYTPLPPALYWGPKTPEACAAWVKKYTGCEAPNGPKPAGGNGGGRKANKAGQPLFMKPNKAVRPLATKPNKAVQPLFMKRAVTPGAVDPESFDAQGAPFPFDGEGAAFPPLMDDDSE